MKPVVKPVVEMTGVELLEEFCAKRAGTTRELGGLGGEVHEPPHGERWEALCAEINRRLAPRRPPFSGPYR